MPRIAYINKMDRTGADFDAPSRPCATAWARNPLPIQLPIGQESDFTGVVDLVTERALVWNDELGTEWEEQEIPAELAEQAHGPEPT